MTDLFRRQLLGDSPWQTLLRIALDLKTLYLRSPRQIDLLLDRVSSETLKWNMTIPNLPILSSSTETQKMLEKTTEKMGETLKSIAENPIVKPISNVFGAEWLLLILGQVDVEKIEKKLENLKEKYPQSKPDQLAHQIMLEKAWEAGRVGLVSNILPPIAVAMLGIELAVTAKLQAEMVYEIAGAYGLNLDESARRGEVLAIFCLSLGTGVLKAGASLVETIPGIGPVVGASTNAIMLYGLGYTACQFYEGKYKSFSEQTNTVAWQQEREKYWQSALAQSRIMDQVLVHIILASYPEDQSWSDILRDLENISPSSVKVVATNFSKPKPLDQLLDQLSPDFAPLLLARCYSFAQLQGDITDREREILEAIANKFKIDLSSFENSLNSTS